MSSVLIYDPATREPLTPGPSSLERGSGLLPWSSFLVERHRLQPVERPPAIGTHYTIGVLHGALALEVAGGQLFSKRAGSVTLTHAGPLPRVIFHGPAKLTVCAFTKPFMEQVAADLDRALPEMEGHVTVGDPAIVRLSALLDEEAALGGPAGLLYAESLARALAFRFLLLGRPDAAPLAPGIDKPASSLPQARLNRVLDAMRAGIADPPSLRALAGASGYSPHHFARMFRAATGATPHGYLSRLRVSRAQELLRQRSNSIAEIALSTGFSSQAHFTTVFRRFTGATPDAWRRDATS